jgi:hypothetical protein
MSGKLSNSCDSSPSLTMMAEACACPAGAPATIEGLATFSPAAIGRAAPRGFPSYLVVLFIALVVALLAELQQSAALYCVLATAIAIGLVSTRKAWVGRRSGKIALLLAVVAILGTFAVGCDLMHLAATASRMSDVIILILCVALIRPALTELKLDHAMAARARCAGARSCSV